MERERNMKANKIIISVLTMVLTVALMFSIFSVPVFAEETSAATSASTSAHDHDHDHDHEEEDNKLVETIISVSIIGVTLIAVAIFCIIKREKVGKFFRSLKSEMKKIVWFSWKDTRKNTIVVIIAVVIIAVFIGLLDFAFNNGVKILHGLFN